MRSRSTHDRRTLDGVATAIRQADATDDPATRATLAHAAATGVRSVAADLAVTDPPTLADLLADLARLGAGRAAWGICAHVADSGDVGEQMDRFLAVVTTGPPDPALGALALSTARSFWREAGRPALIAACARHLPDEPALRDEAIALASSDERPVARLAALSLLLRVLPADQAAPAARAARAALDAVDAPADLRAPLAAQLARYIPDTPQ